MGGGLMQLVAYGAQDVYLTGNPQITFWKVTYRRHTTYGINRTDLQRSSRLVAVFSTISRNGDLAYRTYLRLLFLKSTKVTETPLVKVFSLVG